MMDQYQLKGAKWVVFRGFLDTILTCLACAAYGGGGGGSGLLGRMAASVQRPKEHLQPHDDRGTGRIVSQRSDQCNETAWFGTSGFQWVLGHHRPVEARMGEGGSSAGQPWFLAGTKRYRHPLHPHEAPARVQTVSIWPSQLFCMRRRNYVKSDRPQWRQSRQEVTINACQSD